MAAISVDVPNVLVADLVEVAAQDMARESMPAQFAAAVTIAYKVLNGQTTTAAEKTALGEAWVKWLIRSRVIDLRRQKAAIAKEADPTDPAVTW
jgi:hypothetical protein